MVVIGKVNRTLTVFTDGYTSTHQTAAVLVAQTDQVVQQPVVEARQHHASAVARQHHAAAAARHHAAAVARHHAGAVARHHAGAVARHHAAAVARHHAGAGGNNSGLEIRRRQ